MRSARSGGLCTRESSRDLATFRPAVWYCLAAEEGVRRFLAFVAIGVFVAGIGEFLFGVLIRNDVSGFLASLVIYAALLSGAWVTSKWMGRRIRSRFRLELVYYLAFASLGLMIEWFVIGNSPWRNPSANQPGMLFFWGSVFTFPRILSAKERELRQLQHRLTVALVAQAIGSAVIGVLTPPIYRMFVLVWLVILAYTGLQAFIVWHWILTARAERSRRPHALAG